MKNNIISIGIFFDGTGNNGINATSSAKPPENNESYYSNITNVYKLFGLFTGNEKIYVEGIGTVTGKEDSDFAMATCKNPEGYKGYSADDKLAKAYAFIDEKMHDKTREYHFYVYGFSRGSMLARTFCYELLKPDSGISGNIKVKFLGVFDTVESVPFNNYNVTVLPGVERAFHLCAVNECRYFFPLTGFFEDSKNMEDALSETGISLLKEIFVPGAHADVGGGYLESSQSVYISANHIRNKDVNSYVDNVRDTSTDAEGNKIWNYLLEDYKIDEGIFFSQAYISREMVYNDLSKVYGKLMLAETNALTPIFNTKFNTFNFEIDPETHPYLILLSGELEKYIKNLSPDEKPQYKYEKLMNYTHISANFGLYKTALLQNTKGGMNAELINNGLNVPSNTTAHHTDSAGSKLQSETSLIQDSVIDYAYGTNIPNNDNWSRTILIKEDFCNKC